MVASEEEVTVEVVTAVVGCSALENPHMGILQTLTLSQTHQKPSLSPDWRHQAGQPLPLPPASQGGTAPAAGVLQVVMVVTMVVKLVAVASVVAVMAPVVPVAIVVEAVMEVVATVVVVMATVAMAGVMEEVLKAAVVRAVAVRVLGILAAE